MTPTRIESSFTTRWRPGYWWCEGLLHKHKTLFAAEECERRYPDKASVGRERLPKSRGGAR